MRITIKDDLDLEKIVNSGQCFRPKLIDDDSWQFITGENILTIKRISDTDLDISVSGEEWDKIWHDYFDLERNYSSIRSAIEDSDIYMKEAAEIGRGIRILRQDPWEMLISFIISQRKSIPAIRKSIEALCTKFGKQLGKDMKGETIYAFPSAEALIFAGESGLSDCSLGYRLPYIIDASERVAQGRLNLEEINNLGDDELVEELKTVKGVGDKVANCISLFAYNRTGRAPIDVWIKRVIDEQYNGVDPFPKYKEAAGIMQQYVFYMAQQQKITSLLK